MTIQEVIIQLSTIAEMLDVSNVRISHIAIEDNTNTFGTIIDISDIDTFCMAPWKLDGRSKFDGVKTGKDLADCLLQIDSREYTADLPFRCTRIAEIETISSDRFSITGIYATVEVDPYRGVDEPILKSAIRILVEQY